MKFIVKLAIILVIISIVLGSIYYSLFEIVCTPTELTEATAEVGEKEIIVTAYNIHAIYHYRSYITMYVDGILYIEFKGGLPLFAKVDRSTSSCLPIPNEYPSLKKIILTDGRSNRVVWETNKINQT
ncbi:hypothetical protein RBG61_06775 [Paludicola sp. MB14-C6]|uniref:hypothetical protein n=1 Tax=Paludihabitans sp. MB14-C6 TaxID=3070656 RepID=UPI0027DBDF24|nr:hypothetical protein [Paludicola sp. MB14-C6]WMJ24365.1 hypothetical protein RBG61_06775 [Paludicola sp. MB14-C6]